MFLAYLKSLSAAFASIDDEKANSHLGEILRQYSKGTVCTACTEHSVQDHLGYILVAKRRCSSMMSPELLDFPCSFIEQTKEITQAPATPLYKGCGILLLKVTGTMVCRNASR